MEGHATKCRIGVFLLFFLLRGVIEKEDKEEKSFAVPPCPFLFVTSAF